MTSYVDAMGGFTHRFLDGTAGSHARSGPKVRVLYAPAAQDETPLPTDLSPAMVDEPTGKLTVSQPVGDLVRTAGELVRGYGYLPVSEEDDRIVDALVTDRQSRLNTKPLGR
ncbi:MAG: hypothetical protein A2289_21190 [Deltaproteobacteria bacterium RIFOXYA12_FULL_58_15]|nr:MAG: hypothetical protein A2289_21190 [Deltaproteobacteria bacterium RIFOXYA12_FULL_58_15]OGR08720.1 MAG: hypothetical protein A2341_00800 [Deltaproteobacteria bacterium RIFOXYB12_FULL_58_9]